MGCSHSKSAQAHKPARTQSQPRHLASAINRVVMQLVTCGGGKDQGTAEGATSSFTFEIEVVVPPQSFPFPSAPVLDPKEDEGGDVIVGHIYAPPPPPLPVADMLALMDDRLATIESDVEAHCTVTRKIELGGVIIKMKVGNVLDEHMPRGDDDDDDDEDPPTPMPPLTSIVHRVMGGATDPVVLWNGTTQREFDNAVALDTTLYGRGDEMVLKNENVTVGFAKCRVTDVKLNDVYGGIVKVVIYAMGDSGLREHVISVNFADEEEAQAFADIVTP